MIVVLPSALKHGLTESEVIRAWQNVFSYRRRTGNRLPPHYLALGSLSDGRTVEMVAYSTGLDWHIFHAMTPPTKGFLNEFEGA